MVDLLGSQSVCSQRFSALCCEGPLFMNESTIWLRPKRWLAFFLTLLGVCSFLAIVPVTEEAGLQELVERVPNEAGWSFIDYLREGAREVQASGHWTSLLPPLLAILIAAFFRTIVGAMLSAFAVGSFLSFGLNPLATAVLGVNDFLLKPAFAQYSILIALFLVSLAGMMQVMSRSGGLEGLGIVLERLVKGRRRAKLVIGLGGLLIFFDDYTNASVLGPTMRRLSDRWKISREKLAYLVDSTSAPVAGMAMVSTWVAFEVILLSSVATQAGVAISGYGLLAAMLPLRFYCIGTLIFVFMTSLSGRDFGPMLAAERRAHGDGELLDDENGLLATSEDSEGREDQVPPRWYNGALPLFVLAFGILSALLLFGNFDPDDQGIFAVLPVLLLLASLLAGFVAFALPLAQGVMKLGDVLQSYARGLSMSWMVVFVLSMAWAMGDICDSLGTAQYLTAMLGAGMPLWMMPLLAFVIAGIISFATGTSWGAMGILIPILMPMAVEMGATQSEHFIIFLLTAAAILEGAIFGSHCSPISDTTVLSSISSGCNHAAHVNSQLYYALATVSFSCLFGYVSVAQGMPVWTFYVFYPIAVGIFLWLFGKSSSQDETEESEPSVS